MVTMLSLTNWFLNGLNNLKMGMRIFRMQAEEGILQLFEMQTKSRMSVKWSHEFVDGLSE
jgi:hypothetical protein